MPRTLDYTRYNPHDAQPALLAVAHYGVGELTEHYLRDEFSAVSGYRARRFQFQCAWTYPAPLVQDRMIALHDWLSREMTGCWAWKETHDRRTLGVFLHIEKAADQQKLIAAWPDVFQFNPDSVFHLEQRKERWHLNRDQSRHAVLLKIA